jgi:hypothetical protein
MAAAIELCKAIRISLVLELAFWFALAQLAHPCSSLVAGVAIFLVWIFQGARRPWATLSLFVGTVPGLVMLGHDVLVGAYDNIPGVEYAWPVNRVASIELSHTFRSFFFLSYGIASPGAFFIYLPLLCATSVCAYVALRRRPSGPQWIRNAMLGVIVLMILPSITGPRALGTTFELGPRFTVFAFLLFAVIGGQAFSWLSRRGTVLVAGAVALVMVATSVEFIQNSQQIKSMLGGTHPQRILDGKIAVVRFNSCENVTSAHDAAWFTYDPFWHLWPYLFKEGAVAPQVFAFSGYHQVQLRPEKYPEIGAMPDWQVMTAWFPSRYCKDNNEFRLLTTLDLPNYDRFLAVNLPQSLSDRLAGAHYTLERLTPGFTLVSAPKIKATQAPKEPPINCCAGLGGPPT